MFCQFHFQTARELEHFVANTPLTKAMGEVDVAKDKATVFKKHEHTPVSQKKKAEAKISSDVSTGSSKTPVTPISKKIDENKPADDEEITVDISLLSVSKDSDDAPELVDTPDVKNNFVEKEPGVAVTPAVMEEYDAEEEAQIPFERQVVKGSEYSDVDISNLSIAEASHKLTKTYAEQYQSSVIDYAEEWLKSVTSRIKSRLLEFEKLRSSLDHYVEKVAAMRKLGSGNKSLSPKRAEKLERNELKLNGTREAHHTYGQSLFLLIDEVTTRGWRDLYPLIVNSVHFDLNYSSDQSKLYAKLGTISDMLDEVAASDANDLDIEGRLEQLRKAAPEEVYTGSEYTKVHPVLKAV